MREELRVSMVEKTLELKYDDSLVDYLTRNRFADVRREKPAPPDSKRG